MLDTDLPNCVNRIYISLCTKTPTPLSSHHLRMRPSINISSICRVHDDPLQPSSITGNTQYMMCMMYTMYSHTVTPQPPITTIKGEDG